MKIYSTIGIVLCCSTLLINSAMSDRKLGVPDDKLEALLKQGSAVEKVTKKPPAKQKLSAEKELSVEKELLRKVLSGEKELSVDKEPSIKEESVVDKKLVADKELSAEKGLSEKDLSEKDLSEKDLSEKDSSEKELSEKDLSEKELSEKELSEKELSEKELPEKELSEKELSEKELSEKELSEKELSEKELSEKELFEKELSEKEPSEKELSEKELSEKKLLDKELSDKELSEKVSPAEKEQSAENSSLENTPESDSSKIDISGNISIEARHFIHDGLYPDQRSGGLSLSLQPELRKRWDNDRKSFTFIPFLRWDDKDNERTHADIRQLDGVVASGDWEYQMGISKVFWGVTESQHLVDIINQTDSVENVDGEDKLGQPMLRVSRMMDNGSLGLYVLPYFRERTFSGATARLRSPLVVDTDNPIYESSDEEKHIDYALRWNQTIDDIDLGLSWFQGTSREPDFQVSRTGRSLTPYYRQIKQVGLDVQYTSEAWLWKLEALRRDNKDTGYTAAVGGFEYTFTGINDSSADLGAIAEYHLDSRDEKASTPFQNDIFLGGRFSLNDAQSTELLAGSVFDLDHQSKTFRVEASRRIGDDIKVNLEAQAITSTSEEDATLHSLRADDFIQLEIQRFF